MKQKLNLNKLLALLCLLLVHFSSFSQSKSRENTLISEYNKEQNDLKKFLKLLELGNYYKQFNLQKADSLKTIIKEKSRVFSDSVRFEALLFDAEIEQLNGNREAYFSTVLACQSFLNRLTSQYSHYRIYTHLANYHMQQNEFETADFYAKYAIRIAKKMRSKENTAVAYLYLSQNFMYNHQKDSALFNINVAIQNARRTTDKSLLAVCFNAQAEIYNFFDQVELSVARNILALQLAKETNDYHKIAKFSLEIGRAQFDISNYDDAQYYFKQAYDFASKIHDNRQKALALTDLGHIAFSRNDFKLALKNTETAIKILETVNDLNGLGDAYNSIGTIYREQKEFTKASTNFNRALVYYESIGNKERIASVYHNVGTVFLAQKKYSNALNYLERSVEIRKQFGSQNQIFHTYRVISQVYSDLGQQKKALEYMSAYVNYIDSNTTVQAATKIAELSELYRAEQRDRLILSQADSIERQRQEKTLTSTQLENIQLRNNFQTYIIIGFILIIILAGVIIFYRWNHAKIMQQQREAEMSQTLLRTQMNPHFVFNAMSVIQSYIYENDTQNSSKFLVNFSRLMRLILENSPKEEIPIETEEEILRKYLETQKLRFEDRFNYYIDIQEELHNEGAMIPPMITQPFIENSIEHGQLHTIEGGFIRISFEKVNDMLEITIEDNGIGRKGAENNKKSKDHKSMAMQITQDRISNLNKKYRTDGTLFVEDYNKVLQTGTKILISLPYRTENQSN